MDEMAEDSTDQDDDDDDAHDGLSHMIKSMSFDISNTPNQNDDEDDTQNDSSKVRYN